MDILLGFVAENYLVAAIASSMLANFIFNCELVEDLLVEAADSVKLLLVGFE